MSASVRLSGVAFAHGDAPPLFSDVDLDLRPGWTAIAGPNGAGKSTLLAVVAGELAPSRGMIVRDPPDITIAWCRQAPDGVTTEVTAFAGSWAGAARRSRARVGLAPDDLARWPTLSPGERQRWQIAAALDRAPDVLIVDEPESHLDAEGRRALIEALSSFTGAGVIVAHDRALLDALAARTVWIEGGAVRSFDATYTDARAVMGAEADRARHVRAERKKELARAERELSARRARQVSSEKQRSSRARMKSPKDSDARGSLAKGKAELGSAAHSRAVASMRVRVERQEEALDHAQAERSLGSAVFVDWAPAPRAHLIRAELPALTAGDRTLLDASTLVVGRHSRIHVAGPNGAGKSTLLDALCERWTLPRDRLLVLPQEISLEERRAALDRVRSLPPDERGRALTLLAALGVEPARVLASGAPSPGEARKLLLAEGLARRVYCVVLDEPTNHLDAPSIERLEAALRTYPGALILVSHDARLAERTTRERWSIEGGRIEHRSVEQWE